MPLFLLSLVIKLTKQTFSKELFSFDFANLASIFQRYSLFFLLIRT